MKRLASVVIAIVIYYLYATPVVIAQSGLSIASVTDNRLQYPNSQVPRYEKFEITFAIQSTGATNPQLPYDPNPPAGIDPVTYPKYRGISVEAEFLQPGQTDWTNAYKQPAFIYQPYNQQNVPIGDKVWKVRFAPHMPGGWQYRLRATEAGGTALSAATSFTVADSASKGFIQVSSADPRYFEYDDGTYFPAIGRHARTTYDQPALGDRSDYLEYGQNGITLVRDWMSGFYGSAWMNWAMVNSNGQIYDFYLPRTGLEGYRDPATGEEHLTMVLATGSSTSSWYTPCRLQIFQTPLPHESVKANTDYAFKITYRAEGIQGPRNTAYAKYGLVGKIGTIYESGNHDWVNNCQDPGNLPVITTYGGNTTAFSTIQGNWNSGSLTTLPRVHLALENATQGKVWIKDISIRENLGGGQLGPEILTEYSGEYESYYPERSAYELDKGIQAAEDANIYLKLVVGDKSDMMWWKMQDDGTFVTQGEEDEQQGFYGNWRFKDKKRWLWDAYFRYLQARWGYSTAIHSWELTNEGEPYNVNHWALTDEMGKTFHCRVFGVTIGNQDNQKCTYDHPNSHLVTTSFYHSYPDFDFWANAKYPNVDYADVHAYISTGWQSDPAHQFDTALYHWEYANEMRQSTDYYAAQAGIATKPIVRGEAGIDYLTNQSEQADLYKDTEGVWLHNFTWASLSPSALVELYWWGETIDQNGLNKIYKPFYQFLSTIPLNNGNYADSAATVSNSNLRVTGQKDLVNGNAHLWVQNKNHTWKNVVDGVNMGSPSGTVTIAGFTPNKQYVLEEWNTYTGTALVPATVTSNSSGTLAINVLGTPTDRAYKIINPTAPSVSPTPTSVPSSLTPTPVSGDVNGDGSVNLTDLSTLLANFGRNGAGIGRAQGDLDGNGSVSLADLSTLLAHFGH